jgi:hypothetical protein
VTSPKVVDVWSGRDRALRPIAPTARGYLAIVALAGATIAAAVAPSAASIALAASIAVALACGLLSIVLASRHGRGRLQATLAGPESVPRDGLASLRLTLVGDAPGLGCRMSVDRTSARWFRGAVDPLQGRPRGRVVAPSALTTLHTSDQSLLATPSPVLAVPTARRGILTCRWAALWMYDAIGLFGIRLATFSDLAVVVHPRASRSRLAEPAERSRRLEGIESIGRNATNEGVDLLGIRPYQLGDRLSTLHWRSLSSTVPLLVRELGNESPSPQHLVIDDRAGVHRRADFEKALDLATGALVDRPESAPPLELRSLASGQTLFASPGTMPTVLRWLAALEPRRTGGEGLGLARSGGSLGPGDTVITTATGSASLAIVRRQGAQLVVAK